MKCNFFPVLLSASLLLCSCGAQSSSLSDNLSIQIDDDSVICLYMPEEDVSSILGDASGTDPLGMAEYGSITIGYTDGKVSAIILEDDSCSTVPGLCVGGKNYDDYDLSFSDVRGLSLSESYFSYDGSVFTQIDESISDSSFGDGAFLDILLNDDDSIESIRIYDMYTARTGDFN